MGSRGQLAAAYLVLALLLAGQIGIWFSMRTVQARWLNVPPAPAGANMQALGLGDSQLAYRAAGIMLQNLGDMDGSATPLKDYDFNRLGDWFRLADSLDPRSRFVPVLASFYFGATQDPRELPPVVDYLERVGRRDQGDDWRWLLQALVLARFREHDLNRALVLSRELATQWRPGRPLWMKEMPAFVMTAQGDKKAAYALMLATLKSEGGKVQQAELNSTIIFVCTRILSPAEAPDNPLCRSVPQDWLKMPGLVAK